MRKWKKRLKKMKNIILALNEIFTKLHITATTICIVYRDKGISLNESSEEIFFNKREH